jgi:zinc protease
VSDLAFVRHTLDNGLRLLVSEDRLAPVVAVNVWYDVGSRHEA